MTEAIIPAAAVGYSFWQMMCGDSPPSRAVGKLIDTVSAQLGQGLQTANDLWKSKAEATASVARAKAAGEVAAIEANADHALKLFKMQSLEERAVAFHAIQQNRRQRHIERVLVKAADELQDMPDAEVSDEKVDPDWTTQFFNCAQDIGDEEMQLLWARLLAGEVKQPGSFSRRTLERVKTLSKAEAEVFGRLCSAAWQLADGRVRWALTDRQWVHAAQEGKPSPLTFDYTDCLLMEECGLIEIAGTYQTIWMPTTGFFLSYFGDGFFFQNPKLTTERVQLNAGTFHWTTVGLELTQVARTCLARRTLSRLDNRSVNPLSHRSGYRPVRRLGQVSVAHRCCLRW